MADPKPRRMNGVSIFADEVARASKASGSKVAHGLERRLKRNPRTGRPSDPEGYAVARARLCRNVMLIRYGTGLWPGDGPVRRAWRDLPHSWANVHVEWCREKGLPWPKALGKGAVAMEIGALVGVLVWPVLVML